MKLPSDGTITQGFSATHLAVDVSAGYRSPIYAPHSGTVTDAGQMGSGTNDAGLAVDITSERFKSRLAHNDSINVKIGQKVSEGQIVGYEGYTGYTIPKGIKGSHCHWVLWDNGKRVDGTKYIGDVMTLKTNDVAEIFRLWAGREPTEGEVRTFTGKYLEDTAKYLRESEAGRQVASWRNLGERVSRENWLQNILDLRADIELLKKGQKIDPAKLDKAIQEADEAKKAVEALKG